MPFIPALKSGAFWHVLVKNPGPEDSALLGSETGLWVRLRTFSKGRILKRIAPDFAVTQYFEVYAFESLGVSQRFVKP
jgi:hypothetical protein